MTGGEANPRFVVTSLKRAEVGARHLYEKTYCARGEMENRIKECQLDLFADRTSATTMQANQLRLWFASMAYVLLCALRRIGLAHTQFADATCGTIRLKLLKIGALVRVSVRRIKIAMASACPYQNEFGSLTPCWPTQLGDSNPARNSHSPKPHRQAMTGALGRGYPARAAAACQQAPAASLRVIRPLASCAVRDAG